jgi:pyruvate formate lyase activating enzyme
MPVVPGFNDDEKNIRATARCLTGAGRSSIHCLPYHNLGEAKIPRLHTSRKPLHLPVVDGDAMERVKKLFKKEGIDAIIYE